MSKIMLCVKIMFVTTWRNARISSNLTVTGGTSRNNTFPVIPVSTERTAYRYLKRFGVVWTHQGK